MQRVWWRSRRVGNVDGFLDVATARHVSFGSGVPIAHPGTTDRYATVV
jgi:hypothetical protein